MELKVYPLTQWYKTNGIKEDFYNLICETQGEDIPMIFSKQNNTIVGKESRNYNMCNGK